MTESILEKIVREREERDARDARYRERFPLATAFWAEYAMGAFFKKESRTLADQIREIAQVIFSRQEGR